NHFTTSEETLEPVQNESLRKKCAEVLRNGVLGNWPAGANGIRNGRGIDGTRFYATSSLPDKNSYFSIIAAMPADSPGFWTHRWMRPWHRTLTGGPRVICVGRVISTSTAVPSGLASGKKKYTPPELTSWVTV